MLPQPEFSNPSDEVAYPQPEGAVTPVDVWGDTGDMPTVSTDTYEAAEYDCAQQLSGLDNDELALLSTLFAAELNEDIHPAENKVSALATLLASSVGILALSSTLILMARGGNFKVVRENLIKDGKANVKEAMPAEQKRLRRRKRRKK